MVDEMSGQGYGMAGCGLGSILFGAKPGKIQILSGTTNGIYGNQTFGISSGTSNCDIPEMGQQAAAFITAKFAGNVFVVVAIELMASIGFRLVGIVAGTVAIFQIMLGFYLYFASFAV